PQTLAGIAENGRALGLDVTLEVGLDGVLGGALGDALGDAPSVAPGRTPGERPGAAPERGPAAPTADPLAMRIVRECLTNAARYAPGSGVAVRATDEAGVREVRVRNGPGTGEATAALRPGRGSGLAGLGDEVAARDGTFEAGPDASGFLVVARYPAPDSSAPSPTAPPHSARGIHTPPRAHS
ncbi:MAG: ATP-binding protein, partial [Pseudoclavibacter sp.]